MSYDTLRAKVEQLIEKAQNGGSIQYTDIIYNDDSTATLIDIKGIEHTISYTYENNRIISMTYDGKEVVTVYDYGELVAVGETEVDVSNAPLDNSLDVLIDESGVLDSTYGTTTATEKVNKVLQYADISRKVIENRQSEIEIMPYYDYSKTTSFRAKFNNFSGLIRFERAINSDNITSLESAFNECRKLEEINFTSTGKIRDWLSGFRNCIALKTINVLDGLGLNFSLCATAHQTFQGCIALENVSFTKESIKVSITIPSSVLSDESIQSIIDGLADLTEQTTQTLTLHSSVKAKLTEDQINTITIVKNWTLA